MIVCAAAMNGGQIVVPVKAAMIAGGVPSMRIWKRDVIPLPSLMRCRERSAQIQEKLAEESSPMSLRLRRPHTKITLRYAYEDINNYCNIQDERQRNYFLGVDLAFHF